LSLVLPPLDGRLELKGLLGEGGMGQVFRAWDRTLERAVAVKFVRGTDPKEAERLLLEARLQARVEHPSVVRVHDTGTLEGRPCIVMQLVEGSSLDVLSPGLALEAKVELLRQAAEGIHAAHRQGLVHRDVKPGNILVEDTPEGLRARVTDFGLARDLDVTRSRSGLPAGTLDFMSPEQLLASGPVEFRTDVYGLGATLFAVLTGCLPFRTSSARRVAGTLPTPELPAEEDIHLLRRILDEDPPQLRSLVPDLPRDLDIVVHMAMQKEPTSRYATAEAFGQDLGRFQRGEPILARPPGLLDRAAKWTRRNRTAARALGVAALAILLGLGVAAWTSRRSNQKSLDAARYGALAEALEAGLRQQCLSPAHDLSPVLERIKSEAESLKDAARRGGPAAFARGRALELLGDWDGARETFQRAWDTGYRDRVTADALGLTLIRIYDRELRRARATLATAALQVRQARLDRDLRDPALALLSVGDAAGWRGAWARTALASLQRDFEGARRQAQALRERDPQRYEAWTLEGEIWLDEASFQADEGRSAEARKALDEAEGMLQRAQAWGRSDNRPPAAFARLHTLRAVLLNGAGSDPSSESADALAWIEKALAIRPSQPALLHAKAAALLQQARSPMAEGPLARLAKTNAAIALLEEASSRSPQTLNHLLLLADAYGLLAQLQINMAVSTREAVDHGLATVHRAEALAPEDPGVHTVAAFLHFGDSDAQKMKGEDTEPALRAGLTSAQRALDLQTANPMRIRIWMAPIRLELGRVAWRRGQDPRPDLLAAATLAEAALAENPAQIGLYQNAAFVLQAAADQVADFDGGAESLLARTMAVLDRGEKLSPAYRPLVRLRAATRLTEAYCLCLHDQNPLPAVADARRLLGSPARSGGPDFALDQWLSVASLVEAQWAQHQGRTPEQALADLERRLGPLAKAAPGINQNLAQAALVRAQWLRSQHRPFTEESRRGVGLMALALQADPGDPSVHVIQARLQALAGDGAAARQSLEAARKLNPLIVQGADFRRATQEVPPL
jgi:serine/threonine-protein kinase